MGRECHEVCITFFSHILGTLLVHGPASVLAALLALLAVSDLLHLFDSKSDRLLVRADKKTKTILWLRIDIVSSSSTCVHVRSLVPRLISCPIFFVIQF